MSPSSLNFGPLFWLRNWLSNSVYRWSVMFATTLLLHLWALSVSYGTCVTYGGPSVGITPKLNCITHTSSHYLWERVHYTKFSLTSFVNGVNGSTCNGLATRLMHWKIVPNILYGNIFTLSCFFKSTGSECSTKMQLIWLECPNFKNTKGLGRIYI